MNEKTIRDVDVTGKRVLCRMNMIRAILYQAMIAMFLVASLLSASAQEAAPMHLEIKPSCRVRVHLQEALVGNFGAVTEGYVLTGAGDITEGQKVHSVRLYRDGFPVSVRWITDQSEEKKHLLVTPVAIMPGASGGFRAEAVYDVTLYSRRLVPGAPVNPVRPLPADSRALYLRPSLIFNYRSPEVQEWLKTNHLVREVGESDFAFAKRALQCMQDNMNYIVHPGEGGVYLQASRICQRLNEGTWHGHHCGGLSVLYASALRANGIPARMLIGRWIAPNLALAPTNDSSTDHNKVEFYADGIGWVPVEVANAVRDKKGTFIGDDVLDFLALNVGDPIKIDEHTGRWMQGIEFYPIPSDGKYVWKQKVEYLPLELPAQKSPKGIDGG